jgi:hypothetical protein
MGGYFKWDSGQAEVPPLHATTHQSGGTDPVKLDDLAAPDDNTDLNVSITKHGLTPKAPNDTTKFLRGDGAWAVPTGSPYYVPLSTALTSTSYDGDMFSTQAKTLIDLSAVFGAPAGIKAILLLAAISDTASATSDCRIYVGPLNTAYTGTGFNCSEVNSRPGRQTQIVNCDTNGDVYLQIVASGTNTMAITFQILGYWI